MMRKIQQYTTVAESKIFIHRWKENLTQTSIEINAGAEASAFSFGFPMFSMVFFARKSFEKLKLSPLDPLEQY